MAPPVHRAPSCLNASSYSARRAAWRRATPRSRWQCYEDVSCDSLRNSRLSTAPRIVALHAAHNHHTYGVPLWGGPPWERRSAARVCGDLEARVQRELLHDVAHVALD